MFSKNTHHSNRHQNGFFTKLSAAVVGVFSPNPVPPEEVKRRLERSKQDVVRSDAILARHEKIQAQCEEALGMKF